jgi:hypothetical protein
MWFIHRGRIVWMDLHSSTRYVHISENCAMRNLGELFVLPNCYSMEFKCRLLVCYGAWYTRMCLQITERRLCLVCNSQNVYFLLHNLYKFSSYLTGRAIHLLVCSQELWLLDRRGCLLSSTFFYVQWIRCIRNSQLKYPIVYLTCRWPVGAETCSEKEEK